MFSVLLQPRAIPIHADSAVIISVQTKQSFPSSSCYDPVVLPLWDQYVYGGQ